MVVCRSKAIVGAPQGPKRSGGWRGNDFVVSRGMTAQPSGEESRELPLRYRRSRRMPAFRPETPIDETASVCSLRWIQEALAAVSAASASGVLLDQEARSAWCTHIRLPDECLAGGAASELLRLAPRKSPVGRDSPTGVPVRLAKLIRDRPPHSQLAGDGPVNRWQQMCSKVPCFGLRGTQVCLSCRLGANVVVIRGHDGHSDAMRPKRCPRGIIALNASNTGRLPYTGTAAFGSLPIIGVVVPPLRIFIAANTTVCAILRATFDTSTCSVYGIIRARRAARDLAG